MKHAFLNDFNNEPKATPVEKANSIDSISLSNAKPVEKKSSSHEILATQPNESNVISSNVQKFTTIEHSSSTPKLSNIEPKIPNNENRMIPNPTPKKLEMSLQSTENLKRVLSKDQLKQPEPLSNNEKKDIQPESNSISKTPVNSPSLLVNTESSPTEETRQILTSVTRSRPKPGKKTTNDEQPEPLLNNEKKDIQPESNLISKTPVNSPSLLVDPESNPTQETRQILPSVTRSRPKPGKKTTNDVRF